MKRNYRTFYWHDLIKVRVKVVDEAIKDDRDETGVAVCNGYCAVDSDADTIEVKFKRGCEFKVLVHECLHCISYIAMLIGDDIPLQEAFAHETATYDTADFMMKIIDTYARSIAEEAK